MLPYPWLKFWRLLKIPYWNIVRGCCFHMKSIYSVCNKFCELQLSVLLCGNINMTVTVAKTICKLSWKKVSELQRGFKPMASVTLALQCSTNWATKLYTESWGQLAQISFSQTHNQTSLNTTFRTGLSGYRREVAIVEVITS